MCFIFDFSFLDNSDSTHPILLALDMTRFAFSFQGAEFLLLILLYKYYLRLFFESGRKCFVFPGASDSHFRDLNWTEPFPSMGFLGFLEFFGYTISEIFCEICCKLLKYGVIHLQLSQSRLGNQLEERKPFPLGKRGKRIHIVLKRLSFHSLSSTYHFLLASRYLFWNL